MTSLRQQIIEKIKEKFEAVQPPDTSDPDYAPSPADWPLSFSTIELGPLGDEDLRKRYSVGIVPGREKYSHLFPYIVCDQMIAIEFRVTKNRGDDDPQIMAEQCLTVLKRVVLVNKQWDDLAIDSELVDSETDLTSYGDRSINGVLFFSVKYRHSQFDPRDPNPSVH